MTDAEKDRDWIAPITEDARVFCRRSSARPIIYALILQVKRAEGWKAVVSVDNSHEREGVSLHHMHQYDESGIRQEAEDLPFSVSDLNDAMIKVLTWMADNWEELAS